MSIRVVRLGDPRVAGEGLRLGTVRHPPQGVPEGEIARRDYYDTWLPVLAPSEALVKLSRTAADERGWQRFFARYRTEMQRPDARDVLELLAALSHRTGLAVGCYCADEARCHRAVLRELLQKHGADLA
jgi:uncharacterized protein YeaO (DUF488 family)